MTSDPPFRAWTARAVEQRLIEAAETLMLCPQIRGPKAFGSAMPEPIRLQMDAYASNIRRYRRKPDAAAIDRMEECWVWINGLQQQNSRCLLYEWSRTKCDRRKSLKNLAERRGDTDRALRREILKLCQLISENLNAMHKPNLANVPSDQINSDPPKKSSYSYQHHWRAENARPTIDPAQKKSRTV